MIARHWTKFHPSLDVRVRLCSRALNAFRESRRAHATFNIQHHRNYTHSTEMIILHDPATLRHDTVELLGSKLVPAYESPERILAILRAISNSHHTLQNVDIDASSSRDQVLDLVGDSHGSEYLIHLRDSFTQWREKDLVGPDDSILPECFPVANRAHPIPRPPKDIFARTGYFAFDMSSGIMKDTYHSSLASANLARVAVEQLRSESLSAIVALARPPGHHCNGRQAGGYCYINNAAVAVSTWRRHSPDARFGILDVDFHHGNGSQDIFYSDPSVFYTSIHGEDEFPYYTGRTYEVGEGDGVGMNFNLPLAPGSSFDEYLQQLELALSRLEAFTPELLIVSLGFDTFRLDRLGSFEIDTPDYETLARRVRGRLRRLPTLILLEGGYAIEHLGANLLSFVEGWETNSQQ